MAQRGGRISPDGRPPQAKGVGKNSKRHDLERQKTPGMAGSDLQYGDRQAMEEGQRIAPAQNQGTAAPPPPPQGRGAPSGQMPQGAGGGVQVPDAIDFLGGRQGSEFNLPNAQRQLDSSAALTWLPILRQLAAGPGASSALVNAFVNQARLMSQAGSQPATFIDMNAADEGIGAMLDIGIMGPETIDEEDADVVQETEEDI